MVLDGVGEAGLGVPRGARAPVAAVWWLWMVASGSGSTSGVQVS